jgi:tryptophan-rich sensory protein
MKVLHSVFVVSLFVSGTTHVVGSKFDVVGSKFDATAPMKNVPRANLFITKARKGHNLRNPLHDSYRGGGKRVVPTETNQEIVIKTAVLAALEAGGLLGVIAGSNLVAPTVNDWMSKLHIPSSINGLSVIQWIALIFVIFSSNTMKSWVSVSGSISTATKQPLKPDKVPGDQAWYTNLKKPWFNPPGWVFPIMWLIVSKPTQLIAVSKIVKSDVAKKHWPVLAVYCTHLSLGDAWNEVFFGSQRIGLGVAVIYTFFGLLLTSAALFFGIDETAGKLMLPTCAWVLLATCLNLSIYIQNK